MPAPLCSFCPGKAEFVVDGGALCWPCANGVFEAFRRNKRFREAKEHGVTSADPTKLFRPMVLPSTPSFPSRYYSADWDQPS